MRRGFQTLVGARILCAGPAFVYNLCGHFDGRPDLVGATTAPLGAGMVCAWAALTSARLAG